MADDPARQYLDAKKELDKALATWKTIYENIKGIEEGLMYPTSLLKADIDIQPAEISMGRGYKLDVNQWPTTEQLKDCIINLKQSYRRASLAYSKLADSEKTAISSPDSIVQNMNPKYR